MASHFAMRPLLRAASRQTFHRPHTAARLSTTTLLRTAGAPEAAEAATTPETPAPTPEPAPTPAKTPAKAAAPTPAKKVYAPRPAPVKPVPRPAAKPVARPAPKPAPKPAPTAAEPVAAASPSPAPAPIPTLPQSAPYTPGAEHAAGSGPDHIDWTRSYYGLGTAKFPKDVIELLMAPINEADVEVKPDGILYLPEIKYRRILNAAFGPGGWGLVPKGEVVVGEKIVTREYALIAEGRFISQAQGENTYFGLEALPSAVEGCKSNALMRCCKDLGIASELWDPVFIRRFRKENAEEVWVEHVGNKKKRTIWTRKGVDVPYPYKRT